MPRLATLKWQRELWPFVRRVSEREERYVRDLDAAISPRPENI
jgi:hypothetical protein